MGRRDRAAVPGGEPRRRRARSGRVRRRAPRRARRELLLAAGPDRPRAAAAGAPPRGDPAGPAAHVHRPGRGPRGLPRGGRGPGRLPQVRSGPHGAPGRWHPTARGDRRRPRGPAAAPVAPTQGRPEDGLAGSSAAERLRDFEPRSLASKASRIVQTTPQARRGSRGGPFYLGVPRPPAGENRSRVVCAAAPGKSVESESARSSIRWRTYGGIPSTCARRCERGRYLRTDAS